MIRNKSAWRPGPRQPGPPWPRPGGAAPARAAWPGGHPAQPGCGARVRLAAADWVRLAGLGERVRQLGGKLAAGPVRPRGFRLRVSVPIPESG